jgi:hypothetical protein
VGLGVAGRRRMRGEAVRCVRPTAPDTRVWLTGGVLWAPHSRPTLTDGVRPARPGSSLRSKGAGVSSGVSRLVAGGKYDHRPRGPCD